MEEKMPKKLPPSLRTKKRYIVFEIISEHPVEYIDFVNAFWDSMLSLSGELGSSENNVWIIQNLYDKKNQRGVIRCRHDRVEYVRSSLASMQIIGESKSIVRIPGVTGTVKSARSKYLGFRNLRDFSE